MSDTNYAALVMDIMGEEEFLAHYGVKGMRWGKRNPRNESYEQHQIKRDMQVYGKGGVKRVNRQLNDGDKISVARGNEKTRRDAVMGRNKYVRQGGKIGGAVAGVAASQIGLRMLSNAVQSSVGRDFASKFFGTSAFNDVVGLTLSSPFVRVTAAAGAGKAASMMAGDIAVSANMRVNGYDPRRK